MGAALGESRAAAVLEHKFCPCLQVFASVDVTDEGRFTFSQSSTHVRRMALDMGAAATKHCQKAQRSIKCFLKC